MFRDISGEPDSSRATRSHPTTRRSRSARLMWAIAFQLGLPWGLAATAGRADQQRDELFSGPQAGEHLAPLEVQSAYAPAAGVELDFSKLTAHGDSMLIFVNGANRPAAQLTRALINYAEMRPRDELFAAVVWLADDRSAARDYLRGAVSWWGVGLPVGISLDGGEGPGAYGLNRQVNLTILISRNNLVTDNFALVQPSLTDAPRILEAVCRLTEARVPSRDELQFLSMPTRKLPPAPWVAAPQSVELRRRVCDLLAADDSASAEARAAQLDAYVADRHAARQQLSRLASVLSEGRRKLGAGAALDHIRKWKHPPHADEASLALPKTGDHDVREAATRALRLVEQTSALYLERRSCFTCHSQTMSIMVLNEARRAGFKIDERNFSRQVERTLTLHGELSGLRVDTVGYGLWALDLGNYPPDEMTTAMTQYLLDHQRDLVRWRVTVDRPPAEAGDFTSNYVAVRGLNRYGTSDQQEQIAARTGAVRRWLATAVAEDTEDEVFLLRLAHELINTSEAKEPLMRRLLGRQRDSGGWAQRPEMQPDAYATGSALVALHQAGGLGCDHPAWRRGLDYLVRTQQPDGSWHVASRSRPIQEYFESGFPHGKDQFISSYATSWAARALLLSLSGDGQ